jgi:hypothetical protein
LICSNGFLLFENISSASNRLAKSNNQWVIIPDSTGFGFCLLIKCSQHVNKYNFFPMRSEAQSVFHAFVQGNDILLGENFVDVLNYFGLNLENGLPPQEIAKVLDGQISVQDIVEEHNLIKFEEETDSFSWITKGSFDQDFDFPFY